MRITVDQSCASGRKLCVQVLYVFYYKLMKEYFLKGKNQLVLFTCRDSKL